MKRRDFLSGSLAAVGLAAASAAEFEPCINEQTMLSAPFETACEAWAAAGFKRVELWLPKLSQAGISADKAAAVLRKCGLTPVCACSSDARLTATEDEFSQGLSEMRKWLEYGQELGLRSYVIYSKTVARPGGEDHKLAAGRLARVAEMAERYHIRLALEFFAGSNLLGCLPTTLGVLRAAGHANVGVCLDTFHFFVGSSKTEDLDDLRPGNIAHVHFHDVPATIPRERLVDADRLPPGEGCLRLDRITAALRRIQYRGPLSVELFGAQFHDGDPKQVAARCFRAVRRYTVA
jgi:sugar phosphate isomerase/epimerase